MLIGIVIQMIAITFYVILAGEFFIRFQLNKPVRMESYVHLDIEKKMLGKKMKWMVVGLSFSTVVIFIRWVWVLKCVWREFVLIYYSNLSVPFTVLLSWSTGLRVKSSELKFYLVSDVGTKPSHKWHTNLLKFLRYIRRIDDRTCLLLFELPSSRVSTRGCNRGWKES